MFKVYSAKIGQILLVILFLSYIGCKKKSEEQAQQDNEQLNSRTSEEPLGLPGYKMDCDFQTLPNSANGILEASCSAENQDSVAFEDGTSANVQAQGEVQDLLVKVKLAGTTVQEILDEMAKFFIVGTKGSEETKKSIAEIIATEAQSYRFDASCNERFSLMATNGLQSYLSETSPFTDCDKLAAAINKKVAPGIEIPTEKVSNNGIFSVECSPETMMVQVQTPDGITSSGTFYPVPDAVCTNFKAYIEALGY